MKNSAIKEMYIKQYNVDDSDVHVEFLYSGGSAYTFRVVIYTLQGEIIKKVCTVADSDEEE